MDKNSHNEKEPNKEIECLLIDALKEKDYTRFNSIVNDLISWGMVQTLVHLIVNYEQKNTIGKALSNATFNALDSLHPLIWKELHTYERS